MRRLIIPLLFLVAACSSATYRKALDVSLASLNAARDSFVAFDKDHQLELVEAAPTKEEAKAALASYRKARSGVVAAFIGAYGALAVAAVKETPESITAAGEAVLFVVAELRKLFPAAVPSEVKP
jgi:hypothetical protein